MTRRQSLTLCSSDTIAIGVEKRTRFSKKWPVSAPGATSDTDGRPRLPRDARRMSARHGQQHQSQPIPAAGQSQRPIIDRESNRRQTNFGDIPEGHARCSLSMQPKSSLSDNAMRTQSCDEPPRTVLRMLQSVWPARRNVGIKAGNESAMRRIRRIATNRKAKLTLHPSPSPWRTQGQVGFVRCSPAGVEAGHTRARLCRRRPSSSRHG